MCSQNVRIPVRQNSTEHSHEQWIEMKLNNRVWKPVFINMLRYGYTTVILTWFGKLMRIFTFCSHNIIWRYDLFLKFLPWPIISDQENAMLISAISQTILVLIQLNCNIYHKIYHCTGRWQHRSANVNGWRITFTENLKYEDHRS